MDELRTFMFDRVYLGPTATREHAKIERILRTLFDFYVEDPARIVIVSRASGASTNMSVLAIG